MHIDFAPPSNGTYNNAGSCRQLVNYMEHEDLERMEKGLYTEGFFNLTEDNMYKSAVIKDIDCNIGQLLKIDAKFYAIHVSPSEKELRVMGNTEQKQAEAMKRYIREVFIPEYAKNFNKGLSASDIKFYGKIHFDRNHSDNKLNMHCHLIVSRKDQSNKKKLSPLTNHKNTKNGIIKGGFDRVNLFLRVEQGFDKLFGYDRQQSESFDYHNMMKNGSISKQLSLQEQGVQLNERIMEVNQDHKQEILFSINHENNEINSSKINIVQSIDYLKQDKYATPNPSCTLNQKQVSYFTPTYITDGHENDTSQNEEHTLKIKMKKKKRRSNNF